MALKQSFQQRSSYLLSGSRPKAMTEEEKANHHLDFIDEKRLAAIDHMQCYQQRMSRAFNKKVKEVKYKPGDLVLKRIFPNIKDPRGKFTPNYEDHSSSNMLLGRSDHPNKDGWRRTVTTNQCGCSPMLLHLNGVRVSNS
ncbi:hypothetical protein MLD38_028713 [Melastoma candidum]|uniref:Uncharacterized protein n=1 Tax=Melastoma candidum TaxID=119954 RepID=A0ACB9N354_9MYRT|nr:hypothetical protein MLD38_028713 [Melastoma candidum]